MVFQKQPQMKQAISQEQAKFKTNDKTSVEKLTVKDVLSVT